jgi:hypothetical protein
LHFGSAQPRVSGAGKRQARERILGTMRSYIGKGNGEQSNRKTPEEGVAGSSVEGRDLRSAEKLIKFK